MTLTPERPGTYSYWVEGAGGKSGVANLGPSDSSAQVSLPDGATAIQVLDETSGTVASLPVEKAKDGDTVKLAPGDFTLLRSVTVKVTGNGGKPVEKATVTLTGADGTSQERVLTATDAGTARFENVPMGKATVTAAYGEGASEKATQDTAIAPTKGGAPLEVTVALSGNVPTVDAPPPAAGTLPPNLPGAPGAAGGQTAGQPTIVVNTGKQDEAPRNDWFAGVLGIALLGGGGFWLYRYAKTRGITVKDALQQIGVNTPQEMSTVGPGGLKPAAPVASPLPSLADLPAAGRAAGGTVAAPAASGLGPRLVGLGGPVMGSVVPLAAGGVTVGRDNDNTVPLPGDKTASRRHARISTSPGGGFEVVDEGSSNGTFVNGQRVGGAQTLQPGDEVQIGSARFRFER